MDLNFRSKKAWTLVIFIGVACYILFFTMGPGIIQFGIYSNNTGSAASAFQPLPKPAVAVADVTTKPAVNVIADVTTKPPVVADVTTKPVVVADVTTKRAVVVADVTTKKAVVVADVTTKKAVVADVTTKPVVAVADVTTKGAVVVDVTTKRAVVADVTTKPVVIADVTTNSAISRNQATHVDKEIASGNNPPPEGIIFNDKNDANKQNVSSESAGPSDATHGNYDVSKHAAMRAYRPIQPRVLPCHWTPESVIQNTRYQAFLSCSPSPSAAASEASVSGLPTVFFKSVRSDVTPSITSLDDVGCLRRLIAERCVESGKKVPRVAHYVRFGKDKQSVYELPLDAFISLVSVARFLQPCAILFHGDVIPSGRYWRALLQLVPNIFHVPMERPTRIFNRIIGGLEHSADVARLQILQRYGGVYLDMDHLILRSLDTLRNQSMVIGIEVKGHQCGNGFLIAEPNATFLGLWIANYTDFNDGQWAEHSTVRPRMLSQDYPHLVHVVDTFFNPNYAGLHSLFNRNTKFNWYDNFGLHFYTRLHSKAIFSQTSRIDYQINSMGDIVRHVLYGDKHACI